LDRRLRDRRSFQVRRHETLVRRAGRHILFRIHSSSHAYLLGNDEIGEELAMTKLKKFTLMAAAAATVATAAVPLEAYAGWRGHHHGWHHRHHGGGGSWVPFAAIGGLAAGMLIASAADNDRGDRTYYAPPPPNYGNNYGNRPCHVVHRLQDVDGYGVKMAATMCYDSYGTPYIVQGSQHPVDDGYSYDY
jgi:hypothetical protein